MLTRIKMLQLFFILSVAVLTCCSSETIQIKCSLPNQLNFTVPNTNQSTQYKCEDNNNYIRMGCGKGEKFDYNEQRCVSETENSQKLTVRKSKRSISYNYLIDMEQNVDFCRNKVKGNYEIPELGCSYYIECINEQKWSVKKCSHPNYFDKHTRSCIAESVENPRRCFARGRSKDCFDKASGYFRDSSCKSYYYCKNNFKTEFYCPANKLFDGEKCVSALTFKCPDYPEDELCLTHPDGYYKEPTDGCRTYHYCSRGHKITYLCEEGYTFDLNSKQCVLASLFPNAECNKNQMCLGKSDGYHIDLRSICRKYMFCKNNEIITHFTCRNNKVFNGKACVAPSSYACPSLYRFKELNCMPKQCMMARCKNDGFFMDLSSNCRDYFFCIGGKSTKLTCSTGKVFDGELCVPKDKFSCPSICEDPHIQCELDDYIL